MASPVALPCMQHLVRVLGGVRSSHHVLSPSGVWIALLLSFSVGSSIQEYAAHQHKCFGIFDLVSVA